MNGYFRYYNSGFRDSCWRNINSKDQMIIWFQRSYGRCVCPAARINLFILGTMILLTGIYTLRNWTYWQFNPHCYNNNEATTGNATLVGSWVDFITFDIFCLWRIGLFKLGLRIELNLSEYYWVCCSINSSSINECFTGCDKKCI